MSSAGMNGEACCGGAADGLRRQDAALNRSTVCRGEPLRLHDSTALMLSVVGSHRGGKCRGWSEKAPCWQFPQWSPPAGGSSCGQVPCGGPRSCGRIRAGSPGGCSQAARPLCPHIASPPAPIQGRVKRLMSCRCHENPRLGKSRQRGASSILFQTETSGPSSIRKRGP